MPWQSPLDAAVALGTNERYWALLFSGQQTQDSGRYSYLALKPLEIIQGRDAAEFATQLSADKPALENAWFGYLGYELLHSTQQPQSYIVSPGLQFVRYGLIFQFDHAKQNVTCYREPDIEFSEWNIATAENNVVPNVKFLTSPTTKQAYLNSVTQTQKAIARGDFYQANITRKFTGEFAGGPEPFSLFCCLSEASPAVYSVYMRMDETHILSSSPECFLTIDADGMIVSRPIKGTTSRFKDAVQDAASRQQLEQSEKERAENLMIVDLMRNDLARSCVPASVEVERLFEVSTYATLHHMASTVKGRKRPEVSTLDAVQNAFPPGSMTGAPKIRAIEWCIQQEPIQRGIYSGALGWFGGDGSCDLSVVIRTLIIQGNRFEFQVGGAITADSDPEKEWQETMTKARGILAALGVDVKMLERI